MILSEIIVGILIAVLSGIVLSLVTWPKDLVKNHIIKTRSDKVSNQLDCEVP